MTVASTLSKVSYAADGSLAAFPFPFRVLTPRDLKMALRTPDGTETALAFPAGYSVTGAGQDAGGTATLAQAPAAGQTVVLYRDLALTQELDLANNDPFDADQVEGAFDRLTMIAQQLKEQADRALTYAVSTPTAEIMSATEYLAAVNAKVSAAQSAQSGALAAQGQAEADAAQATAQAENAEASKVAAQTARSSAEAAQDAAQTSGAAAQSAQAAAATYQSAALLSAQAAQSSAMSAAAAQAGAQTAEASALAMVNATAWASGTAYTANQCVIYAGQAYRAIAGSTGVTPGTDPSKWRLLGFDATAYTTAAPTLTGTASANEGTTASGSVSNFDAAVAYVWTIPSALQSTWSFNSANGAFSFTLPLVSADTAYTLSLCATKAGELRSAAGTRTVTSLDISIQAGPTLTFTDSTAGWPDGDFS